MGIRTLMRKSLVTNLFFSDSEFPKREGQESVRTDSLLYDIARQCRENLGIICYIYNINGDHGGYIRSGPGLKNALCFILNQLKKKTGETEFFITLKIKSQVVLLDISWSGKTISSEVVRQWENLVVNHDSLFGHLCLAEIMNLYQSSFWAEVAPVGETGTAHVIACMPRLEHSVPEPRRESGWEAAQIFRTVLMPPDVASYGVGQSCGITAATIVANIYQTRTSKEVMRICPRLPDLIRDSLEVGASVTETTDLITAVSDAVVEKFISLAMVETGPAPTDFAFVCLGSEGRCEQTLKTDQDNAILFNDLGKGESLVSFQSYFLKLGERVCSWLDKAGYNFCKGGIMANNPRWCQPLSVWKDYFSSWIHTPCPEDLLHACVFFDLRFVYGKGSLADKLSTHLFKALSGWPGFFRDMAEHAVYFSPPIDLFGRIRVNTKGANKNCIDLKTTHLLMVDYVRIYALKHGVRETATHSRLCQLYKKKILTLQKYHALIKIHEFMIELRFRAQIKGFGEQEGRPRNWINLDHISIFERQKLRQALKQIKSLQAHLQLEFMGTTSPQAVWF